MEGRQGPDVTLAHLLDSFTKDWEMQRETSCRSTQPAHSLP